MDEWTGEVDRRQFAELQSALRSTLPGLLAALRDMKPKAAAKGVVRDA
jgi:hypothetical protein